MEGDGRTERDFGVFEAMTRQMLIALLDLTETL